MLKYPDQNISAVVDTGYAGMNKVLTAVSSKSFSADDTLRSIVGDLGDDEKVSFAINGQTFVFDLTVEEKSEDGSVTTRDTTLQDVMDAVNSKDSATNVKMSIDDATGAIKFETKKPGQSAKMTFQEISGGLFGGKGENGGTIDGLFGISNDSVQMSSTVRMDMTLADLNRDSNMFVDGKTSFSINGTTFTFTKDQTLQEVMDEVNNSGIGVTMSYDAAKDAFSIKNNNASEALTLKNVEGNFFNADGPIGIGTSTAGLKTSDTLERAAAKLGISDMFDSDGNFSFVINGKTFSFDKDTTVASMMKKVNADSDVNVKMSYSEITDSFTFRSSNTGADVKIELANADGSKAFGAGGFFGIDDSNLEATGSDAEITFVNSDGSTEVIKQSGNTFTLDGITYTIKEDFDAAAADGNISFGVTQDNDAVIDKVKTFIEDYNKIVEALNNKITEEKEYDYSVLTEAEREELSEEDLEKWDAKAKSGILRNDSAIKDFLSDMRTALFEKGGRHRTFSQ